jgi:hypothetical protein
MKKQKKLLVGEAESPTAAVGLEFQGIPETNGSNGRQQQDDERLQEFGRIPVEQQMNGRLGTVG